MRREPRDAGPYTSSDVCAAAGIDRHTLKNWVSRAPAAIRLEGRTAPQRGLAIQYSGADLARIRITARLVRVGFTLEAAARAAEVGTFANGRPLACLLGHDDP